MMVTVYTQECNSCGRVWTFRTDDSVGSHNSQSCPQCGDSNSTMLRVEHKDD